MPGDPTEDGGVIVTSLVIQTVGRRIGPSVWGVPVAISLSDLRLLSRAFIDSGYVPCQDLPISVPDMFRKVVFIACALVAGFLVRTSISSVRGNGGNINSDIISTVLTSLIKSRASTDDGSRASNEKNASIASPFEFWPPIEGERYPDLVLEGSNGQVVRLSDHAGKVILVELAAIPCHGCQAFAGGNQYGGYADMGVQTGLDSIHLYAQKYASVNLKSTDDVLFVQLLLYGKAMGAPTREETSGWAEHFRMNDSQHEIVLRGDPSMVSQTTYSMIPGFHLIDRDFILRSDSCGHNPKANLYSELLPMLKTLSRMPRPASEKEAKITANPFVSE